MDSHNSHGRYRKHRFDNRPDRSRRNYSNNRNHSYGRNRNRSRFKKRITFDIVDLINKPGKVDDRGLETNVKFEDLGLDARICDLLYKNGFTQATPIQENVIPKVLQGKSILGIAPTGTGKTASFLLPIINRLLKARDKVLIIAPTRELAIQIYKEAKKFNISKSNLALVIGGESMGRQIQLLQKFDADIVIGTPGRLLDLERRDVIIFSNFSMFVVDEVDRMLDMGFIEDVKYIYNKLPGHKQSLFFSATFNKKALNIVKSFVPNIDIVSFSNNMPVGNVQQDIVYFHTQQDRIDKLIDILKHNKVQKALVFVNTKVYADRVYRELRSAGINAGVIHGDKSQYNRRKVIGWFRNSSITVLVATNVAARGIDIYDISHVINLDAPLHKDEYIHRVGRAGRFGRKGYAVTFLPENRNT